MKIKLPNIDKTALKYTLVLLMLFHGNLGIKFLGVILMIVSGNSFLVFNKIHKTAFLYLYIIAVTLVAMLFSFFSEGKYYFLELCFSMFFWLVGFLAIVFNYNYIQKTPLENLRKSLDYFFVINAVISLTQLLSLMISQRTINPYANGIYGETSGDFIMGIFSNCTLNEITNAFFFYYYYSRKSYRKMAVAGLVAMLTTFMTGLIFIVSAYFIVLILDPAIRMKYKLYGFGIVIIGVVTFSIISPENVHYAAQTIESVWTKYPPRKIVSFGQTYEYLTENPKHLLLGAGPGKFSSRTAFVFGGEYVSWLPKKFVYKSPEFKKYHFSQWNNEVLARPFSEGSSNQPFSWYNQILGEYGLIGFSIFLIYYMGSFFSKYRLRSYGRYILIFILFMLLIDYWFEYIAVMVLFEIFLFMENKSIQESYSTDEEQRQNN